MTGAESSARRAALRATLDARRDGIAQSWVGALTTAGYVAWSSSQLRERFAELTGQAIDVLLDEQLEIEAARAIGATLVQLGYALPEVLGRSQEVLGQQLCAVLMANGAQDLQSRLVSLLGNVATGFSEGARKSILGEQEAISQALVLQRHQAEEALRESEERFRAIFEESPIGIAVAGMDGRVFAVNQTLCSVVGYRE
jgi:PAS domain-containing protein